MAKKNKGKTEDIDVADIQLEEEVSEGKKKGGKKSKAAAAAAEPVAEKAGKKAKAKEVDKVEKKGEKAKGAARSEAREGMVTAAELAEEYGVPQRTVRQVLRDAELEKPEHGWAWKKSDPQLKEVRALLKGKGNGGGKAKAEEAPAKETSSKKKGKK